MNGAANLSDRARIRGYYRAGSVAAGSRRPRIVLPIVTSGHGRAMINRRADIVRAARSGKLAPPKSQRRVTLIRRRCIAVVVLTLALAAGNALAVSKEAQEFMDIQAKIAPDQCALQRLSTRADAAQRAGDQGKRQELMAEMEPIARRIQTYQPRMQQLTKSVQATSPDYQAVIQQTKDLRAKCKP